MSNKGAAGVWFLALGQTLGYACLFYIFAALILSLETDLGWDKRLLAVGPMLALGASALLAPFAGRLVDAGHGRILLAGGAGWGALGLVALSQATTPGGYLAAWVGIGVAQSACLYEAAFAYLIRRYGPDARPRIIRVTLVAGLASTLAFPAGAALADAYGWRNAMLVAAGVMALVTLPLHWVGTGWIRQATALAVLAAPATGPRPKVLHRAAFWGIAALFTLIGLNHWMLISFLVPLLVEMGVAKSAAILAASLVGPSQTLGRLVLMRFEARIGTRRTTTLTLCATVLAAALLAGAGLSVTLVFAFAALQGAAMGIVTILRPMLVAETLGRAGFGTINGLISIPTLGASALAPLLAAILFQSAGPQGMIAASLCFALGALLLAHLLPRG